MNPNGPDLVTVLPNLPAGMSGEERRGEDTQILSFFNKTQQLAVLTVAVVRCLGSPECGNLSFCYFNPNTLSKRGNACLSGYPCEKINCCHLHSGNRSALPDDTITLTHENDTGGLG